MSVNPTSVHQTDPILVEEHKTSNSFHNQWTTEHVDFKISGDNPRFEEDIIDLDFDIAKYDQSIEKSLPDIKNVPETIPSKTSHDPPEGGTVINNPSEKIASTQEQLETEKPMPLLKIYEKPAPVYICDHSFKLNVFLEFMFYHTVYLLILGPIAALLLRPLVGKTVLQNQRFWGRKSIGEIIFWCLIVSSIACFIMDRKSNNVHYIYPIELYAVIIMVFIRIVFVSSKYAYANPKFLAHFRSREMSIQELKHEEMSTQVSFQDEAFVHHQIQESILRIGVDTSAFYFTFLGFDPIKQQNQVLGVCCLECSESPKKATNDPSKLSRRSNSDPKPVSYASVNTQSSVSGQVPSLGSIDLDKNDHASQKVPSQTLKLIVPVSLSEEAKSQMRKALRAKSGKFSKVTTALNLLPEDIRNVDLAEGTFRVFQRVALKDHELQKTMHSAYTLAVELTSLGLKSRSKIPIITSYVWGLLRGFLPLVVRAIEKKPLVGSRPIEIYLTISIMILTSIYFRLNLRVATAANNNTRMKLHMLAHLSNLLPSKKTYGLKRKYPPLNIFNPVTLRCWQALRVVLMDYGLKFQLRMGFNITVYLIIYLLQLLVIVLYLLDLTNVHLDMAMIIIGLYEAALALVIFFLLLIRGAMINEYLAIHRSQLLDCRGVISDLKAFASLYFGEKPIEPDHKLKQEGIRYLRELYKGKEGLVENCVSHLKLLEEITDRMLIQLDNPEYNYAFKVLGFRITFQGVKAVFLVTISIGAAILTNKLEEKMKKFSKLAHE